MILIQRGRLPFATVAAVLALALAACASGDGDASGAPTGPGLPSASSTTTATATSTATADPVVDPHPALSELQITTRGLLPLTHSDPIVGNAGEAMLEWDDLACYFPDDGLTENPGRWVAAYPADSYAPFSNDGHIDGTIHRIDIWDATISTPEGVHVGTTRADLEATYPGLVTGLQVPGDYGVFWIADEHGYVVFETGMWWRDGEATPEHVAYIRILAPSVDPNFAVEGTENIAGDCLV